MFLFIVRIMAIPDELFEAAAADGARRLRTMWHVTIPLIRPTIVMVVMLTAIESLKLFDLIYVMTNGGPGNATEVLSHYAYLQNFQNNNVGYGSALLVVLLAMCLLLSYIVVGRLRSTDD
jgi:ABC-type sugar transport system permease subunit